MASSHAHRDHTGRFSPAPVPPADMSVDNVSGDPQGEHDHPLGTVYPDHDYRRGPVHHLIPHRAQRVINAETGEELSDHITDVRAVRDSLGGRTTTHVIETDGVPFLGDPLPVDTMRGHRTAPLQPGIYPGADPRDGHTLPGMYARPDIED